MIKIYLWKFYIIILNDIFINHTINTLRFSIFQSFDYILYFLNLNRRIKYIIHLYFFLFTSISMYSKPWYTNKCYEYRNKIHRVRKTYNIHKNEPNRLHMIQCSKQYKQNLVGYIHG
jgi:hypothetical protein